MQDTLSKVAQGRRPNTTGSRTAPKPFLNDFQWDLIKDLFPEAPRSSKGGRPSVPSRDCIEGILWVLKTGARWKDLPDRYPSFATCWRRFRQWTESGAIEKAWTRLIHHMDRRNQLNWSRAFGDGTFSPAKKGVSKWERPKRGRGPRSW